MLSRLRKALRGKALRRVRERWRGRGWRRVRRAAAVGRKGTTVAIFQIRGQAVAGNGRTTFSLRDLYLRSRLGAATRRQSQDSDKAFGFIRILGLPSRCRAQTRTKVEVAQ